MTIRSPRVPFSLDPLIAEARQRARRRWLAIALAVALLAGGTAVVLRSSGASPLTDPQAVLGSTAAAALAQHSVRWTAAGGASMSGSYRLISDVTAESGVQRLTITPGRSGTAEIRLVDGVVYVKGNFLGLQATLALNDMQAVKYGERWISVPTGDPLFVHLSDGLTLASVVHDATSPDFGTGLKTKVLRAESHGTPVLVFEEGELGGAYMRLTADPSGERLPVAVSVDNGPASWMQGTFRRWNARVHPSAPKHAVPIATVRLTPERPATR